MASIEEKAAAEPVEKVAEPLSSDAPPVVSSEEAAPPPEVKSPEAPPADYFLMGDVILRVLLFASSVAAVVVIVTSNQTALVSAPVPPFPKLLQTAKFQNSPALIYFVTALSLAGLYSIISTIGTTIAILKPSSSTKLIIPHLVIFDVLLLGAVAAATGSAGAVGYIGWKGNSHTGWTQVCDPFTTFCKHIAVAISISLFASVILTILVLLSLYSISKKVPK
ncbi:CASP-like protein 1 [Impatiens glandulifera]|uniref:CASP-like protein 1 n=1 Tax=Impatiens glandulifera TaxID=253017 RepID=UPI001FB051BD|nr:CASP-like protein 1 [Impatiens glandulifera]